MIIYRVEDKDGIGPYQSTNWDFPQHQKKIHNGPSHPNPEMEALERGWSDHCGFDSIQKLKRWFAIEDRKFFGKRGFKLVVFDVPEHLIKQGKRQLVFKRDGLEPIYVGDLIDSVYLKPKT